ncbi:hypothetical protein PQX77_020171, partial [Marasmius sp. AFHP31]
MAKTFIICCMKLPESVKIAGPNDRIAEVFKSIPESDVSLEKWEVFVRRMDVLFGENVRDTDGNLVNIMRGPLGMDLVVKYLQQAVTAGDLDWEAAQPKFARLVTEIQKICSRNVRRDDSPPIEIFDEAGRERVEETDMGAQERVKRVAKKASKKSKRAKGDGTEGEPMEIESGDESDGGSALRKVVEREEHEKSKGSRRGPANESLQHFTSPTPVKDGEHTRWQFKCIYCKCIRTVERTVGTDKTFDDEPKLPKLNNMASHTRTCKERKKKEEAAQSGDTEESGDGSTTDRFNLKRSADFMVEYLKQGELNPAIEPTTRGFLRLFAAWILDDDLPWTTGESPSLAVLFKYLKVKYQLPSDTTVRNQLAVIFAELHGKVVRELSAIKSKIAYATDTWTTKQMVYTFACTIASFIDDDWCLIERVVDFKPLDDKEHEGVRI